jgi:DinB superfamily
VTECSRIADQLRRAFMGEAWHGPDLRALLANVTAEQAESRPLASAHSIWELVLHIDIYLRAALDGTRGIPLKKLFETGSDWPAPSGDGTVAWSETCNELLANAERLAQAIEALGDDGLERIVPGRTYNFYYLYHGVIQHSLYHAGQIAMLKGGLQAR